MAEEVSVKVYHISSFIFEVFDENHSMIIEGTVNYSATKGKENIISEAWLHSSKNEAMMYLADTCTFAYRNQTEDEIENYLLDYYHNSEIFAESVAALLAEQYDYFTISKDEE